MVDFFSVSGLPKFVADSETMIRFLKDGNCFNKSKVKHQAFSPRFIDPKKRYEVSVFRDQGQSLEHWKNKNTETLPNKSLHGIAKISAGRIRQLKLEVEANDTPPGHANIIEWPNDSDLTFVRAQHHQLAQALAENSKLVLY